MVEANLNLRDNVMKAILEDSEMFAQFLNDFVPFDLLKGIAPENIFEMSTRLLQLDSPERDSDTIKKVLIDGEEPFYIIIIVEHQSKVDFRMPFRMLQYIVYVLDDYEKRLNRAQDLHRKEKLSNGEKPVSEASSRTKEFQYPPVLPIVFYDGPDEWTAAMNFKDRVLFSDIFSKYIPSFEYLLIKLKDFSDEELIGNQTEFSFMMLVDTIRSGKDFKKFEKVPPEFYHKLENDTSDQKLKFLSDLVELLLAKVNIPPVERVEVANKLKHREVASMFAMLEDYDVQETRRIARMEGIAKGKAEGIEEGKAEGKAEGIEEGKAEGKAEGIVNVLIGLNFPKETILAKLQEECGLSEEQALTWYNKFI